MASAGTVIETALPYELKLSVLVSPGVLSTMR